MSAGMGINLFTDRIILFQIVKNYKVVWSCGDVFYCHKFMGRHWSLSNCKV